MPSAQKRHDYKQSSQHYLLLFLISPSLSLLLLKIIMNNFIVSGFPLQKPLVGPGERLQQVVPGVYSIQPLDSAEHVRGVCTPSCSSPPLHIIISFLLLSRRSPLLHSASKCARCCLPWALIVYSSKSTRSANNNDNSAADLPHGLRRNISFRLFVASLAAACLLGFICTRRQITPSGCVVVVVVLDLCVRLVL